MIKKNHYLKIAKKFGDCASWAVWADEGGMTKSNVGNLEIFDLECNPNILQQLNPNVVMVGLNISRKIKRKFGNFHDGKPRSMDYKIRYAFKGTKWYGAYMTDVIKNFEHLISGDVISFLKKDQSFVDQNITLLRQELADLKVSNPLIIAFGNAAYDILCGNAPYHSQSKPLGKDYRVVKIRHYSDWRINKVNYRDEVKKLLGVSENGTAKKSRKVAGHTT